MSQIINMKDLPEGLKVLIEKMFEIVDADKTIPLVGEWYTKYSWNEKQEQEFKQFFLDFYKNHKQRYDVINHSCKTKEDRIQAWRWFNLQYGWKRNDL